LNVGFDAGFGPVVCGTGIDSFESGDAQAEVIVKAMENAGVRGACSGFADERSG
jgi:hypothetical protein